MGEPLARDPGLQVSKSLWRVSGFHARHLSFQQIPETSEFVFPVSVLFFALLSISFHSLNVWLSRLFPRMPGSLSSGTYKGETMRMAMGQMNLPSYRDNPGVERSRE